MQCESDEKLEALQHILAELKRRSGREEIEAMLASSFPKQIAFINDPSPLVAGFCTRRAGKSYGVGLKLCITAMRYEAVSCVYIALTRLSAKAIMYKDILKAINRKFHLGAKFNEKDLTMTFPNGSIIYLLGMDCSEEEANKALGQKFKLCVIDEAGSFRRDLYKIVYQILKPACADLRGQIIIISTPTDIIKGLFYDVVWKQTTKGWSIHKWTAHDNPYIRKQWQEEIDELIAANPRIVETPWYKQQYLGMYVIDTDNLIYKYDSQRNGILRAELPEIVRYVLGIDLGFNDASAFTVLGYPEHAKKLYIPFSYKEAGMDFTDVANYTKTLIKRFDPYKIVVDNASKQGVQEMINRHGLPLEPAEKSGKIDFIKLMNSEYICQNIHVVEEDAEPLVSEYGNLIWDDPETKDKEHPGCENHCCDSALYGWRECLQYANIDPDKLLTEQEKLDIWFEREAEKLDEEKELAFWERM